ncbi:hypothetical protein SAMN05216184_106196 [Georgenia satyanarayanai]|uniref:VWFA domain-containing protein n=1 Tax=Georgenia satyanarayanai TaxID=860221 RepID=A0A2Y9ADB2_9MICO|nr:vWA domain-containing protein [Georgenia satyanarayanai]PYF99679.1 hypothetical protein A8987_106196 [Georgenia satyanarayanai]SSA42524.1 hypothetical protein SAMN05216184_106196 [Georgenia satyanarayanai]
MPTRHRRTPPLWRRGSRALLVGLTSLTLVISGTATLAAPQDDAEVAELLSELSSDAVETADAALEETTDEATADEAEEPAAEEPAAEEPAAEEPAAEEPAAEEPAAEEPAAEEPAAEEPDLEVTPFLVPPGEPGPDQVKLIVRSGGDRTGTGNESTTATPLAGVTYEFYRVTDLPPGGQPEGDLVGSCTTDGTGECGIFADLVGVLGGEDVFYAVQADAPAGWTAPQQWSADTPYIFGAGPVSAADSVDDRTIELPPAYSDTVQEPTWASIRANNVAPAQCGLDMAMVLDLSNSVTETEEILDEHKTAANDFIASITGTPSQVALYTFGSQAPAEGPTNGGLPLTSVATPGGAEQIVNRINGYRATPSGGGGTNWDRAFHQVAESGVQYDVVLFLTDGQPTFHRDRQGPGDVATIAEVNEAILSANAVKATGAQVVLVGFGPEAFLPGASVRIPLVSGPTEGEDFYRTDLEDLSATLEEIASADCAGTLTVVKEVVDADGDVVDGGAGWTFSTETDGVTPTTATTGDSSAVNFAVDYTTVLSRSVTVTETQQAGYELVPVDGDNARCVLTGSGEELPVTNSGELGFTVDVAAADSVSCTVRNALVPPDYDDLVVTKTAVPSFTRDWDWDITKVAEEDRLEVPAGEDGTFTYDVTVTPEGPVDSGFTVSGTVVVTNPNDVPFTGVTVLDSLPSSTCSVPGGTNVTVPAGDSVTLNYTCDLTGATPTTAGTNTATVTWDAAAFPGTDGSSAATADFDFAAASVAETDRYVTVTDSEYDLSDYPGGNALDATDGEAVLTYDLEWPSTAGQCVEFENTATIVNSPEPMFAPLVVNESSTEVVTLCAGLDLEVEKNVVVSFDRMYLWEIDKEADETTVTVDPATGTATAAYTVTATPTGSSDAGWAMQGTVTVTNPNEWLDITADVTDTVDVGGGAVCTVAGGDDVLVAAGATVDLSYTCTFVTQPSYSGTNTATATWADTVPTPGTSATGTADVEPGDWAQTPINETITVVDDQTDPASPVELGPATWNADGTPTVFTYSLELEGAPGACVEYTNTAWIAQTQQSAEEVVEVCVPELEVAKRSVSADQLPGGGWLVTYEIDVVNPEAYAGVYSLSDTLEYGGGITPTAALWFPAGEPDAGGEWTEPVADNPTTVLATDVEIAAGTTDTYVVVVTADVPEGVVGTEAGLCDDEELSEGGGFLNAATLTVLGEDETVRACAEPVAPTVEKTAGELVAGDDGTWDVSYTIDVANPDADQTLSYDLSDELDFVEGVDILDASIERDGTVYGDWDGVTETEVVTGVLLPAATTHTYTVTVTVSLSDVVETDDGGLRECGLNGSDAGHGLFNLATITSGNDEYDDDACVPIPDPDMSVDKTAVSANQLPDGTWEVVYEVVASNDSAVGGAYDLSDTLEYSDGITPLTAEWALEGTGVAGEWGDLPDELTATLASDRPLAGGDSDSYVVTVTAAVAEGVVGGEAGQCSGDDGTEGGGFLNAATLAAHGEETTDRDCAEPVAPTVEKTAGDLVAGDGGTWDVSYTVDVANPDADQAVVYDLTDELGLAEGVDIVDATIERDGTVYGDWDGTTQTEVVTGVTLPPATTHTYTVTVTVGLTETSVPDDARECGDGPGQGLFNGVVVTSGADDYDDDACLPVPGPELSHEKTVVSAVGRIDGDWEVVYEVVVTNDSALGGMYDLTDTLEFGEGITPLTAEWVLEGTDVAGEWTALPDDVTTVLANDRPLAGESSHTYVVTVVSDVAAGVVGTEEAQCTGDEGTDGGGFLNAATLTAHGEESTERDCVPPTHERLEKVFDSAVERADGRWEVGYTLVVDNSHSPWSKYYRLEDTPRFAQGVTIREQEAWDVTDPQDPQDLEWDGEGPILEQAAIGAGEVQRYELTFVVEVDADIPAGNLVCGPEGPGRGFFNRAELTTGNDTIVAEDCGPITPPRTPGLPPTGAAVAGAVLLAVLLSAGGLALGTTRRRKEA